MAKLEKVFYVDSDALYRNKGGSVPPWYPNWKVISNWYFESGVSFCYNIVNDKDVYLQYGRDDVGWASARFLSKTLDVTNEVENSDGSITADITVTSHFFNGMPNNNPVTGYETNYLVKINGIIQYDFTDNSRAEFTKGARPPITFSIKVDPQETNTQTAYEISFEYPNKEVPDSYMHVGIGLFNPNVPTYTPMSIRKTNQWKDLNSNNGKILIRQGSSWIDKSKENISTSKQIDKGKNRIRKSNNWRQLPPMEGDQT